MQLNLFTYEKKAKPFLKWAGGKTQLIKEIDKRLPSMLKKGKPMRYIEPFVGSGALLFHLLNNYKIKEAYIIDINENLINLYLVIKNNVFELIEQLKSFADEYKSLSENKRKEYYYLKREEYNQEKEDKIKKAALLIFLNKTCFNGLYRTNKKGEFNVPFGKYKNPKILDQENLIAVANKLKNVNIYSGDFEISKNFPLDEETLIYFDPPYRPISKTSSFTSYSANDFDDNEQIRLKKFFDYVTSKGAKAILSNSDPKNFDPNDSFFDNLYKNYIIERIFAKRSINSNSEKRGYIREILIRNYEN
ncbi:DNA adenine methylase [Thermosipho africanus H17ap60334]|uniref:DNA adenine methylase n=1 Tax=Thermosipho africanus TaxID=2421 RepID=UPI00028EEF21|nr:DNA adenine methylase [Thermosipho africanus]EKF48448.1 DNA adenine methylase [Thermosipho africanus H17ap60334]RDI90395.1 DNA adenine methylase [Thermosipho africanus Ob7]